jgi:hypothetical protein
MNQSEIYTRSKVKLLYAAASLFALYFLHYLLYGAPSILPDTPMYLPVDRGDFSLVSFSGDLPRPWIVTLVFALLVKPIFIVAFHYLLAFLAGCYLLSISIRISGSIKYGNFLPYISFLFLICGPPLEWASSVQSDALAMTLSCAFSYAIVGFLFDQQGRKYHFALLLILGTLSSLIRFFIILFFIPLVIFLMIKAIKMRKAGFISSGKYALAIISILVCVTYSFSMQTRMDYAWGLALAQHENVKGRTMQQLGVVGMNPVGKKAIQNIFISNDYECLIRESANPEVKWWGELAHRCTDEVELFSNAFQAEYLKFLLSHPRAMAQAFGSVYTQSFSFNQGFVPDPIFGFFRSSTPYQPTLLLFVIGLTGIMIRDTKVTRKTEKEFVLIRSNSRDWTIIATIWLGHFGVFLTAVFSPSDTYRVASSIATSTLFLTLVSVLAVAPSRLFGLQGRNSKVGANE